PTATATPRLECRSLHDALPILQAAAAARSHVEANFDYVGDAFAREARAIHAGESEARPIYGEATPAEVRDLKADGVPCAPLPPADRKSTRLNSSHVKISYAVLC